MKLLFWCTCWYSISKYINAICTGFLLAHDTAVYLRNLK